MKMISLKESTKTISKIKMYCNERYKGQVWNNGQEVTGVFKVIIATSKFGIYLCIDLLIILRK